MARPIYPYELGDPDFSWLLTSFLENNPEYATIESGCLPVVLIKDLAQPIEAVEVAPEALGELPLLPKEPLLDDQER